MRPSAFTDGNPPRAPGGDDYDAELPASMRPSAFTDGNVRKLAQCPVEEDYTEYQLQ